MRKPTKVKQTQDARALAALRLGKFLQQLRNKAKKSLREVCLELDLSVDEVYRLETGTLPLPTDPEPLAAILAGFARALDIKINSLAWVSIVRYASHATGLSPAELSGRDLDDVEPRSQFGSFIRQRRLELDKTLREFCLQNYLNPGNHSRLERGLIRPPERIEELEGIAVALEIEVGGPDWYLLVDLAAADRGQIPADWRDDKKVMRNLHMYFEVWRRQLQEDESIGERTIKEQGFMT